MSGGALALLSLVLMAASLAGWLHGMQTVQLEGRRGPLIVGFAVALLLAVAAFVQGVSLLPALAALFSLLASGVFLGLAALSGQESKTPTATTGEPFVDFAATRDDGTLFDTKELHGRPFLLKFFRGHW